MGFKFFEKNKIVIGGAVLCCLIMVTYPEVTAQASKEAISLWLNAVVPTLLPFFFVANFLKKTGVVGRISPKVYPFAMALLSGYPMGARIAGDGYREGRLSVEQLRWILSYSMITGPAFLIGAVGVEFLGSHGLGIIIAVCHYAGAFLNSLFYGGVSVIGQSVPKRSQRRTDNYYNILTDAMLDSFQSIAIILAYIMIFMIATDLIQFSGVLSLLPTAESAAVVKGMLELTVGCNALRMCQSSAAVKAVIASFIVTFGGFSVLGQSMSMLRDCNIRFTEILVMKLSHGVISGILTFAAVSFVI
ncbi:MAG: hypothetical protein ACLRWH_07420 [Emergencia sp.]